MRFIDVTLRNGEYYVTDYYKSDTHDEDLKKWKEDKRIFGKGSPPISGGPVLARFYEKDLADEYAEFKTNQLKNK